MILHRGENSKSAAKANFQRKTPRQVGMNTSGNT
jgi:hypothetical protein